MDFNLMISSFPKLLNATLVTLKLVSLSLIFGIFLGILFAILRTGKNKFFRELSYYYSYIFRGTPMLVQLFRNDPECILSIIVLSILRKK